jgi:hypothetical protein
MRWQTLVGPWSRMIAASKQGLRPLRATEVALLKVVRWGSLRSENGHSGGALQEVPSRVSTAPAGALFG